MSLILPTSQGRETRRASGQLDTRLPRERIAQLSGSRTGPVGVTLFRIGPTPINVLSASVGARPSVDNNRGTENSPDTRRLRPARRPHPVPTPRSRAEGEVGTP